MVHNQSPESRVQRPILASRVQEFRYAVQNYVNISGAWWLYFKGGWWLLLVNSSVAICYIFKICYIRYIYFLL